MLRQISNIWVKSWSFYSKTITAVINNNQLTKYYNIEKFFKIAFNRSEHIVLNYMKITETPTTVSSVTLQNDFSAGFPHDWTLSFLSHLRPRKTQFPTIPLTLWIAPIDFPSHYTLIRRLSELTNIPQSERYWYYDSE